MAEIDHIDIRPGSFGWLLIVTTDNGFHYEYEIGDAIQFQQEVDRTIGRWLADGPADFHGSPDVPPTVLDYDRKET